MMAKKGTPGDTVIPDIANLDTNFDEAVAGFRATLTPEMSTFYSDEDLLRFLRGRRGSYIQAKEMLVKHDQYRRTVMEPLAPSHMRFSVNTIWAMPNLIHEHPHVNLIPLTAHGFARDGSPVYWERSGSIQSNFSIIKKHFEISELMQHHIYTQECSTARLKFASEKFGKNIQKCVSVLDMKGLCMSCDFAFVSYMKTMIAIDQDNYPERLQTLIVINAPRAFTFVFAMFKSFIDPDTLAKFVILGSDYMKRLEEVVPKEYIPVECGGTCKNVPWGGPFTEESGCSPSQVMAHFRTRYTEENIPKYLHAEEQESLRIALAAHDKRNGVVTTETGKEAGKTADTPPPVPVPSAAAADACTGTADSSGEDTTAGSPPTSPPGQHPHPDEL